MADPAKLEPQTGGGEALTQPLDSLLAVCPTAVDIKGSIPTAEPQVKNEVQQPEAETQVQPKVISEHNSEVIPKEIPDVVPENKPEATSESKPEITVEIKPTESVKDDSVVVALDNDVVMADSTAEVKINGDWQQREQELLKRIEELELVKNERSEDALKLQLKVREEEIDLLKARVKNLETELQAVLSKPSGKNHEIIENIKQQHEELLTKARGMIFDKTKMVKNQELQIEALTTQVQSLKDINQITKDLLEIRNSEVKAMEDRLQAMEARFKAEKDRYGLVLERAHTSSSLNDDLKKEYETQLAIFKELREKYEQRVQALVADNNRLKEEAAKRDGGPSS